MVGLVQPLRLSVEPCEIEQKGPRTNTEQCRLPPSIQNASTVILPPPTGYESGVSFRFGPRFFRAAHVSCTCIFSRVNRCTCAAHVCATIPARGCRFSARVHVRGVRAHGKDSCWIVTLASGGAVHGGEQAVVSSAAISIRDSKPKPAEIIRQRFCYCVTG
jgi:hypothetical protein